MPGHRRPESPALVPSLAEHARAWDPTEDPGVGIDRAINEARAAYRIRRDEDAVRSDPDEDAADEADRRNGERERDAWNARHPIGQAVIVGRPDGTWYRGRTATPATLLEGNIPAVVVDVLGFPGGFWPLDQVEPVAELPTATAAADEVDRRDGERERDEWNARHPIGQPVIATRADETSYRGRTASVACMMAGIPVVVVSVPGFPETYWSLSRIEPVDESPDAVDVAAESERPGGLPVPPAAPGPRTKPDALAVLCHALGVEFLALAEARRAGAGWDEGHWKRLRGAIEAAGVVLDAGPRAS